MTPRPATTSKKLLPIDADNRVLNVFRSAAALLVVFGHVRLLFFKDYANVEHSPLVAGLYSLTSLGSEAVIIFFVLSGYWVGGSVISRFQARRFAWSTYASARLTRLWLVLIPALAATLLLDRIGIAIFPQSDVYEITSVYDGLPEALSYSPLTFVGNLAFLQGLHVPVLGTNQPLWSLAFEFWYYLLFPGLLASFWQGSPKSKLFGAVVSVAAIVISGPAVLVLFPVWLLGAGVAAARRPIVETLNTFPRMPLAVFRGVSVVLVIGASIAAHELELPFGLGSLMLGAATAVAVAAFIVDVGWSGVFGRLLSAASWTAHSSYSLYATHMPLVTFMAAAFVPEFENRWTISFATTASFIGIVIVCCIFAYVFARFTERKTEFVREWMSHLIDRPKPVAQHQDHPPT